MIKVLLKYFKPHLKLFFLDIFCAILASVVDLSFPLISRYVMYNLLPNKLYKNFFIIMAFVFIFFIIRAICYYVMTFFGHTFGVRVETDIRESLFKHLQSLDFSFYDQNRTGNLISHLTVDLFDITELSHHGPEDFIISSFTITGALVMMFFIDVRLAFIVSLVIPIFLLIVVKEKNNMSKRSRDVKVRLSLINNDIEMSISGIKTAKAFSNEDIELKRFVNSNDRYKSARKYFFSAMAVFNSSQELFMGILPVVIISAGGYLVMKKQMNLIDLITFTLFVSTFVTPVRRLVQFAEIYSNGVAGLKRFHEIMSVKPILKEKDDAKDLVVNNGTIDIENVYFSYDNTKMILSNINLSIKKGEMIAIVGESGGGKTTLSSLIPRFYDVNSGSIKIDNVDIRDVKKRSIRKAIGIVQQDVFIFADTIMENIRYGRLSATDEEVIEAAKKAEIYDDIMEMKDKFNTYVGERGTMLSGGQKQRISIARIILKDPKILILDEATSALDTVTEKKIQKSFDLLMKGRTSLVIAHRLSTIKGADRIIVLNNGMIEEEGTHEELLKKDGIYKKLTDTQNILNK